MLKTLEVDHCYTLVLRITGNIKFLNPPLGRGGNFGSSGKGTTISYYGGDLVFGVPGGVGGVQYMLQ